MTRLLKQLVRTARSFSRETRGAVIVPLALIVPVLFGFGMLAIDAGRYFNLHTSVQSAADSLALAAAAELDGKSDSINRAYRAIDNLIANDQRFGDQANGITRADLDIHFLKSLPPDGQPIPVENRTDKATEAAFVEVAVKPVRFSSFFAAAAGGVSAPMQTQASAVAGFDSIACNITPLFMCNPFEGTDTSLWHAARDPSFRRRLIAMKDKATKYFPGNRGYLKSPNGETSGSLLKEALAMDRPKGCYKSSGVELRPGAVSSTAEAINVRFDLYDGAFKKYSNDPIYRPATNVRKGYTGPACAKTAAYDPNLPPNDPANADKPLGFPRDPCFYTGTCTFGGASMGGRIGDGDWDFEAYWAASHPGRSRPNGWANTAENRPSRYDVYRYEIENNIVGDLSRPAGGGGGKKGGAGEQESGAPQCYSGDAAAVTDNPDRRTFVGAILDCIALDQQYDINGGSSPPLPVTAYAKFFLTEPADKQDGTFWVELVQVVEPGTEAARNVIRDQVQLAR